MSPMLLERSHGNAAVNTARGIGPRRAQVLQVVLNLSPGGTERLVIELSKRLHRQYGMHVCCLDERGAWAGELESLGISVTALGRQPGFQPLLARRIARVAERHGATVLHCHQYSPFVYGAMARAWHRCQVVFTEHGRASDAAPSRRRRIANALLGRVPAHVFSVSADLRRHMVAEGFEEGRIGVIHNGIAVGGTPNLASRAGARAQLNVSDHELLIGAVGRLDRVKDLSTLLAAIGRLRPTVPNLRLVLVGDGPEREDLVRQIEAAGLRDCVTMTGHRQDVRQILAGLDIYVNCSIFEGISLTILEAMAAGIPVVATRIGGTPEVVIDGETGCLVPARDPNLLARAIAMLAEDRTLARTMGSGGRQRVQHQFTLSRMVDAYAMVYRGLEGNLSEEG